MLSRNSARVSSRCSLAVAAAIAWLAMIVPATKAGAQSEAASERTVTETEIRASIEKVRKDPNLAEVRKVKTLRPVDDEKKENDRSRLQWLENLREWIGSLFGFLVGSGRVLFWVVLATLAGLLLVYLWRLARNLGAGDGTSRIEAPSFVRDLDIRPESLPDDIGAEVRRLWDGGEHRGALALLYRGVLSRLVHVYRVPIRDSSTEGDCIDLASRYVDNEERRLYVRDLVRVWQRAVYGGEAIPSESVYALGDQFSRMLDAPSAAGTEAAGARA